MNQYTEEQLKDPKVRIEIYKQALKEWRTPWFFWKYKNIGTITSAGFCYYFPTRFILNATYFLQFELEKLRTTDELSFYWFAGRGYTRRGRRVRRKALRKAIKMCEQKIKE